MDFSEVMANVLAKVPDESKTFVESQLKSIERQFAATAEDVRIANSESRDRRLKLRDAENKIQELESEVEKLKSDTTVADLTKQVEALKGFQSTVFQNNRNSFKSKIESISKHAAFAKAAPLMGITLKEDGSIDVDKMNAMNDDQITTGFSKLTEFEELGLFETDHQQQIPPRSHTPKMDQTSKPGEEKIEGWATRDPVEFAKYLEEKNLGDRRFKHLTK